jgi:hypothetical protein
LWIFSNSINLVIHVALGKEANHWQTYFTFELYKAQQNVLDPVAMWWWWWWWWSSNTLQGSHCLIATLLHHLQQIDTIRTRGVLFKAATKQNIEALVVGLLIRNVVLLVAMFDMRREGCGCCVCNSRCHHQSYTTHSSAYQQVRIV